MYILTKKEGDIESGAFASPTEDGTPVVQFFVDKDDAAMYNTQLEAIGQTLHITETDSESVDKLCSAMGYVYTIVSPGEFVIPRDETLYSDIVSQLGGL